MSARSFLDPLSRRTLMPLVWLAMQQFDWLRLARKA